MMLIKHFTHFQISVQFSHNIEAIFSAEDHQDIEIINL